MINALIPLPVVLPLFAAGWTLAVGRRPRLQRLISVSCLAAVLVIAAILVWYVDTNGPVSLAVGGWVAPLGIELVVDRLSAMMLAVSSAVTLLVLLFSLGQGVADANEQTPLSIYHPTYLVLSAGVANAFLAGDIFNLFVGFEILLVASYVLLTLGGTRSRVRAGTTYVVVAVVSSLLFLITLALIYAATGTLNLAQLSYRLDGVALPVVLILQLLLLVVFGIKAAIFPLSAWLPDSYPTAPAPVTAVFAGLLTKVGVYAILRMQTLLFERGWVDDLLMWAGLFTMVVGILGAVAQNDMKRMLSFTLVSHIGFIVFGIGMATTPAYSAAIYYVIHHIIVQTTLFLLAGLVTRVAGTTAVRRLGGLAGLSPWLAVGFLIAVLNLAGIPPMSGFLGKTGLFVAALDLASPLAYLLVAGGALTTLLTLFAVVKVWNGAFWQTPPPRLLQRFGLMADYQAGTQADSPVAVAAPVRMAESIIPKAMAWPTAAMLLLGLMLTVFAGPLYGYTERTAEELQTRGQYVDAVLDGRRP